MSGIDTFRAMAPELLSAAEGNANPSRLLELVRRALTGLQHYDLPIGVKIQPNELFPTCAWIAAFAQELKSPNWFMSDFRYRSGLRKKWNGHLQKMVTRVEKVASWEGLKLLERQPACGDRMAIQVVRLVPSVRNFLRDTDNSAFCTKQLSDALHDCGLIREDRREWLTPAPLLQDVSPITVPDRDKKGRPIEVGVHVTLFILRPASSPALFHGVPTDADRRQHPDAHREGAILDRGAEEGRTVPGPRRRTRARAIDV